MKRFMTAAAIAALAAIPAAHADSGVVATYDATPDQIWEMVDFHQPSENIMPPISTSERTGEGVGAVKYNTLAGTDGAKVHLLLTYYAPEDRAFTYHIHESPLPVANYVGEVRVTETADGKAQLSWQGTYDAAGVPEAKADEILGGFYQAIAGKIGETYPIVE